MAASFLFIVMAASAGVLADAETGYNNCLSGEVDMAVSRRVEAESFAAGLPQVCRDETATYRRIAVAAMVGQGLDAGSPEAAERRFDAGDRAARIEAIATFNHRMQLRRGPARVAGLTVRQAGQSD